MLRCFRIPAPSRVMDVAAVISVVLCVINFLVVVVVVVVVSCVFGGVSVYEL